MHFSLAIRRSMGLQAIQCQSWYEILWCMSYFALLRMCPLPRNTSKATICRTIAGLCLPFWAHSNAVLSIILTELFSQVLISARKKRARCVNCFQVGLGLAFGKVDILSALGFYFFADLLRIEKSTDL